MIIGIPKEVKDQEYRCGASPEMVATLVDAGHRVLVQSDAGVAIGFTDALFSSSGAEIVPTAAAVYAAEMVIKVKEPQEEEFPLLRKGQVLFCYLHLAPDPAQTKQLLKRGVVGIAFETVTDDEGRLPLLVPMSEIAGKVATQVGATFLQMNHGGRGVLLGGVPGVPPAQVLVIGGGTAGWEAAKIALGMGAKVTVLDRSLPRLRELAGSSLPRLSTQYATEQALREALKDADLVIGAVLIPGKKAAKMISREMLIDMKRGSVLVDIAIDQGGIAQTSRVTTHTSPTYVEEGVVHYCVPNMPSAVARTATEALTHAILPAALSIASRGVREALLSDPYLKRGLNVYCGLVTHSSVAQELGYNYISPDEALN